MVISRFANCVQIHENCYAVYNSLVMVPIFLTKHEHESYLSMRTDNQALFEALKSIHVYIPDPMQDEIALHELQKRVDSHRGDWDILYLIVTSSCNLACKYCFLDNNPSAVVCNDFMSKETAFLALDKFAQYGKRTDWENTNVLFYGGEPLLNFEVIKSAIEYCNAKNYHFNFSVITNATLLTPEHASFFAKNNVELGISIDGPMDVNDKNRIYKNSPHSVYEKVTENILMLQKAGCGFSISCTASPDLIRVPNFAEWAKSIGVHNVYFNIYHYSAPTDEWRTHYPEMSKFILNQYFTLKQNEIYDGKCSEIINNFIARKFKHNNCGAIGRNQVAVASNGDIFICQGDVRTKNLQIGNIYNDDPNILLRGMGPDEHKWTLQYTINNEDCLKCEALCICGGGCPLQSEALFGNRNCIDHASCIFYKEVMHEILYQMYLSSVDNV